MRFWKRLTPEGKTAAVESYSHDSNVDGAVEINEAEFYTFIIFAITFASARL